LLLAAVVAAGCGSRASDEQKAAARSGQSVQAVGAGARSGSGDGAGDVALGTNGDGGAADSLSAGDAGGATGGGSTGASGGDPGTAGGTGGAAPAAPDGGNGGATDVGVTDKEVLLGNVSTLSGPVPGLFQGAVIGAQAVVAYQNSLGGMFGRKFKLEVRDDQFDSGQNRAQTMGLMPKVFGFLGSFSLYDDVAAAEIGKAGIPDMTYSLSGARRGIPNNFSVQPALDGGWPLSYFNWYTQKYPNAVKAVGAIYGDVPASKANYLAAKAAAESLGWKFVYERGSAPTETDYTADVVRMRQSGVKMVYLCCSDVKGMARIAKAMQQQGFKPEAFAGGGSAYDQNLLPLAGTAAEGMTIAQLYMMFQGEDDHPEIKLFNQWAQKIKPGYKPDLFATFSWAEGRLLFKAMEAVGPKLTRAALIEAVRKVGQWDSYGMISPANPGTKTPPTCFMVIEVRNARFNRLFPSKGFECGMGGYHRSR
jgi:ABC-type branched-subunit amino acid transport system substrate-binding protein